MCTGLLAMLTCFCYSGWIQWAVRSKHVPALPRWLKHICECGWLGFVGWSSCVPWIVAAWPIFIFSSRCNWHLECGSSSCAVPHVSLSPLWFGCQLVRQMNRWPAGQLSSTCLACLPIPDHCHFEQRMETSFLYRKISEALLTIYIFFALVL